MALDGRYKLVFHSRSLAFLYRFSSKRSSFKMIFFALKISSGGVCCMHAVLLFYGIVLFVFTLFELN